MAAREPQLLTLRAEQATLEKQARRLKQGLFRVPPASDQRVIAEIQALIAPNDCTTWSKQDTTNALDAQLERIKHLTTDVEIMVLPQGKNFTTLPHLQTLDIAGVEDMDGVYIQGF